MGEQNKLVFEMELEATPPAVYAAFATALGLQEWFADLVEADARPGGRFYAWWNAGFYTVGMFKEAEAEKKLVFTWHAAGEPAPTEVTIRFEPQGQGTLATLTHDGLGEGEDWEVVRNNFKREWNNSLANLKSVLENGVDRRQYDRPMLGFFIAGVNNPEQAKNLGTPVDEGVIVAATIEGMGAEKAGLQGNDVIVSLAGKPTPDLTAMGQALRSHKGGDVVVLEVYRGQEKLALDVELSKRPVPEYPPGPDALAEIAAEMYAEIDREMDEILAGVTEEEAAYHPAPGEWNVKETLVHLLVSERWTHDSVEFVSAGQNFPPYPPANFLHKIVADQYTLAELRAELKRAERITIELVKSYPEHLQARRGTYFTLNNTPNASAQHFRSHYDQLRNAVKAAREAAAK